MSQITDAILSIFPAMAIVGGLSLLGYFAYTRFVHPLPWPPFEIVPPPPWGTFVGGGIAAIVLIVLAMVWIPPMPRAFAIVPQTPTTLFVRAKVTLRPTIAWPIHTRTPIPTPTSTPTLVPSPTPTNTYTPTPTPTVTPPTYPIQCLQGKMRITELGLKGNKIQAIPGQIIEIPPDTVDVQVFGTIQGFHYNEFEAIWLKMGTPESDSNWQLVETRKAIPTPTAPSISTPVNVNPLLLGTWGYSTRQNLGTGLYYLSIRAWFVQFGVPNATYQSETMVKDCWITVHIP